MIVSQHSWWCFCQDKDGTPSITIKDLETLKQELREKMCMSRKYRAFSKPQPNQYCACVYCTKINRVIDLDPK